MWPIELPKPCKKFRNGKFAGLTEHVLTTGCKECARLVLFVTRRLLMKRYGEKNRN
jgi:hypothetical protein